MDICAITCVKNEGPFLLEWLAYHHMIGVSHFLIYSNDCDDGTCEVLDAAAGSLPITHLPNPTKGQHYQMGALKDARKQPCVGTADWVWISDVDEFLCVHAGDGKISDLIQACGDPSAISVTFRYFANAGIDRFVDRPVIRQFMRCHAEDICASDTAIEVKTLVQKNFPLHSFGAHRPFTRADYLPHWTDGSGRPVPETFVKTTNKRRIRRFPAAGTQSFATLNHYALRSRDTYLVKRARGDVNRPNRAFDVDYWTDRNDSGSEDRRILTHMPALRRALHQLKSIPEIGAAHKAAVAHHRTYANRLRKTRDGKALLAALDAAPRLPRNEAQLCEALKAMRL
jgi:hypothetical protein